METRIEQELNRILIVIKECKKQGMKKVSWPYPGIEILNQLIKLGYELVHVSSWGSAYVLICWR